MGDGDRQCSPAAARCAIGSANVTGAGIIGHNLELGVLVRGHMVAVVEAARPIRDEIERRVRDLFEHVGLTITK